MLIPLLSAHSDVTWFPICTQFLVSVHSTAETPRQWMDTCSWGASLISQRSVAVKRQGTRSLTHSQAQLIHSRWEQAPLECLEERRAINNNCVPGERIPGALDCAGISSGKKSHIYISTWLNMVLGAVWVQMTMFIFQGFSTWLMVKSVPLFSFKLAEKKMNGILCIGEPLSRAGSFCVEFARSACVSRGFPPGALISLHNPTTGRV